MGQALVGTFPRGRFEAPEEQPIPLVQVRTTDRREEPAWDDFGHAERVTSDDVYWDELLEDRASQMAWERRRPRRVAVKILGWTTILAALAGVLWVAGEARARDAVMHWGTMGQTGLPASAAQR